jgi:hypothetical protein
MSSVSGYDTSYSAIKDIHQDLNLGGAGNNQEFEFLTGYSFDPTSEQPMRLWQDWMNWVLFNQVTPTYHEAQSAIETALNKQKANLPANSTTNNNAVSIYEAISADARLSKFKDMIDTVGYGKIHEDGICILAPVNDEFDHILAWQLQLAKPSRWVALLQLLRFHILPYVLKPWQFQNRILRLRTDLEQTIESDWTKGNHILLNKINPGYVNPLNGKIFNPAPGADPYTTAIDSWFPKISDEVSILGIRECVNGYLYIISRPVVPADLL